MPHLVKPNWLGTLKLTMAENKEPKNLEAVTECRNALFTAGDGCSASLFDPLRIANTSTLLRTLVHWRGLQRVL